MASSGTQSVNDAQSLAALLTEPSPVLDLAARFSDARRRLYLVGGPVRDLALRRVTDPAIDLATDAVPDETLAILKPVAQDVWLQGIRFGTVGTRVQGIAMEITTFRTETYQPASRHPVVEFATDLETDLSRRDFTVNSMAIALPGMERIDPFGGLADLEARVLRTPMEPDVSFSDDPLRMLRAFRFASQLGFEIADEALDSIKRLREQLKTVSAERIRDELSKLVLGKKPGRALKLADATGITELFLPELGALKLEQDPVHQHKDVFLHTLAVLDRVVAIDPDQTLELRLAALLHDIGKPRTRAITNEGVSFHHHDIVGARMAEERMRALRYSNDDINRVGELIRLHHRFHTYRLGWSDSAVRRYVRDAGPFLGTLNKLVRADCTTRNPAKAERLARRMDELDARIRDLARKEEMDRIRPDLDGFQVMAYLGVEGGPIVGRALDYLMEIRMEEGPVGASEAYRRLDEWARREGIEPAGAKVEPRPRKKAPEPSAVDPSPGS